MKLAILQPDNSFRIDGIETSLIDIMKLKFRVHKDNGDIEIYDSAEDMPIPVPSFDLDAYKQQVNEAHNAFFRELYMARNYLSIGEISLWVDDAEFGEEARALRTWWNSTCKIVADYLETVTEETAQPVEQFIQSLPPFQV